MPVNEHRIPDPQTFFKTITIIHLALVAGQALFGIVAFFITNSTSLTLRPVGDIFFYVVPLLAITGIITGNFLFKQKLNSLSENTSLKEKLSIWQTATIIKFATAEAPSLLGIAVYLITRNLFYLFVSGLVVLYFIWIGPKKENIAHDLHLSYDEKIEMDI